VQFYFARLQTARDAAQLPLKFDAGRLSANTLSDRRCQDRGFGAGVEEHGCGPSIDH
jgi:hypothetical protein